MNTKRLLLSGSLVLTFIFVSVYHTWSATYPSVMSTSTNEIMLDLDIYGTGETITTTSQVKNNSNDSVFDPIIFEKNIDKTQTILRNTSTTKKKIILPTTVEKSPEIVAKDYLDNDPSFITLPTSRTIRLTPRGMYELANRPIKPVTNELFADRNKKIRQKCQQHRIQHSLDLSRMIYDDKHKFIMCVVPKNACTSWKRMIWYLLGYTKDKNDLNSLTGGVLSLDNGNLPLLSTLKKSEAMERLLTYTSFVVMRDPYDRIVSAYSNKFSEEAKILVYKETRARRIAKELALSVVQKYFGNTSSTDNAFLREIVNELPINVRQKYKEHLSSMRNGEISFDQFTEYLISSPFPNLFDVHWRSQMHLCNPCAANYDVVIKFEDLGNESNHLLEYLQQNDNSKHQIRFNPSVKSKNSREKVLNYFKTLSTERTEKIKTIYKDDFNIYHYSDVLDLG